MTTRYTIIQYVPNPIADERLNIGVITWDEQRVCSHFLADWRRVKLFGVGDVGFLRDFAQRVTDRTSPQLRLALPDYGSMDAPRLQKMIGEWGHSIQFTEPRGSLKDAGTLLRELVPTFLRQPAPRTRRGRNRRAAAAMATRFILTAMKEQMPDQAEDFVKTNATLEGRFDKHRFDVVLAHGRPLAAVHAISFEIVERERLEKEIEATAWTVDDMRKKHRVLPLAVFVLQPSDGGVSSVYTRAVRLFRHLNAEIVTENKMPVWAHAQARSVALHAH